MIRAVRANRDSFHPVEFGPGMNVVLAERTLESTRKDSRNGLGKSMLLEIMHFCLGSEDRRGNGVLKAALQGWTFSLDLLIEGRQVTATRAVDHPQRVIIDGDLAGAIPQGGPQLTLLDGGQSISSRDWVSLLGQLMFALPAAEEANHRPSFRSLISYFIRRGRDAFSLPFSHHRKQSEIDQQINVAFLLGLAWEDARDAYLLKEKLRGLADLKRAIKTGVLHGFDRTPGDLEATKIRLQEVARVGAERLATFRVHPEYAVIRVRADEITREIHDQANRAIAAQRLLTMYRQDSTAEQAAAEDHLVTVYSAAGVELPERVVRRLEDVRTFHRAVLENRRSFLREELERLEREIRQIDAKTASLSDERSGLLQILQTHGALAEYTALQQRHLKTLEDLKRVESLLENWRQLEKVASELRIDQELLQQRARRDYEERSYVRSRSVRQFNENSEALYAAPGRLRIDVRPKGFEFGVEIERSGSDGIENMKVFCFDLMLAQLWANRPVRPGFLVHDSRIFDGVDERQKALALQLAARESEAQGFQYICTLNSDAIPAKEFDPGFDLSQYVRLTLTDAHPSGSLFGFRF